MIIKTAQWKRYTDASRIITSRGSSKLAPRRGWILRLECDDGETAHGEATPFSSMTGDGLNKIEACLRKWSESCLPLQITDEQGSDPSCLLEVIDRWQPTSMAARSAIETALLDLVSRRQGRPAHQWLCSSSDVDEPREIRLSGLLTNEERACLEQQVQDFASRGFASLKLKLRAAADFEKDLERLDAVRRILRGDRGVRADVNGQWSIDEARVFLRRLADYDLEFVEEPVGGEALLKVGDCPVAVAADESLLNLELRREIFASRSCSVAVLKPTWLGGPLSAWRIAHQARRVGIEPVFTHAFEGPLATVAAMEVALSMAPLRWPCGLWSTDTWPRWKIAPLPHLDGGRVISADRPGLAIPHFELPR